MSDPLVSILLPVYCVEPYLETCLNSIINQTYKNLQIVLIDDGSLDNSYKICQSFVEKDDRIEIYHQENMGVASTRNHLLEKAKGEYLLFVDSDDWLELDMIEYLIKEIQSNSSDIIVCEFIFNNTINENKQLNKLKAWNQEQFISLFLRHKEINGSLCNKLIKTQLVKGLKFDPQISYGEDALFFWQILQRTNNVVVTDRKLYHYRMNDNSISHQEYGWKKMSGHKVWQQIAEETAKLWPKYKDVATANYAISDMWQIYYAALSNYKMDENIKEFQKNVRSHLLLIYKSKLINNKKMLFATIASFSYSICKFFT